MTAAAVLKATTSKKTTIGGDTVKRGKYYRKRSIRFPVGKSIVLSAVSLLLVCLAAVTSTISWIEDVSQVEFNTNNESQQTPVHIGSKILKSDAVMKNNASKLQVLLADYFNKSGDMHLSPCYGDGENFYFPVQNSALPSVLNPREPTRRIGLRRRATPRMLPLRTAERPAPLFRA